MARHLWSTKIWQGQSVKVCLRCGRNENIIHGESLDHGEDCEYVSYDPTDHGYDLRIIVPSGYAETLKSVFERLIKGEFDDI